MTGDAAILVQGLVIGVSVAAPVGPIALLCIQRTLTSGIAVGFASGVGAALADAAYGTAAAAGLVTLTSTMIGVEVWLRILGGLFLLWLAVRTWRTRPAVHEPTAPSASGVLGACLSTAALTLTNPMTIVSFIAIFSGLGMSALAGGWPGAAALVTGIFLGSAAWWLALACVIGLIRRRLSPAAVHRMNRVAALVLAGFGASALVLGR